MDEISSIFYAIGTNGDHVYIFIGAAPRYSPSKVMQIAKSITARELFVLLENQQDLGLYLLKGKRIFTRLG